MHRRAWLWWALVALAMSWTPVPAGAQVAAPSLVEEDLAPEESPPAQAAPEPQLPPSAGERERAQRPARKATAAVAAPREPVRAIEPVRARYDDVVESWRRRREALRAQDSTRAAEEEKRLLALKAELGIENLDDLAATELRAAAQALERGSPGDAVASATFAVALAPDLPSGQLALARARLALDPWKPAAAIEALQAAVAASAREPRFARAFLADLASAAVTAAFAAAALLIGLLFLRRVRLYLHDLHRLPLLGLGTELQVAFVGVALLALPTALRLGPAVTLVLLAVAVALYLGTAERVVVTLALAALAALPWGAEQAARLAAWPGTLAEDVHLLEHGSDDSRRAARLEAVAERGELPPAALLALGRHHKRRGELAEALQYYQAAGPVRADVLVDTGNVLFLKGDVEGARAAYLSAIDRAGARGEADALAAAYYDLSRVFLRGASLAQAQEARKKAVSASPAFVERYGGDESMGANRWLIDVPAPEAEVAALAIDDTPRALAEQVARWLGGPVPAPSWPWIPGAGVVLLWALSLARRRLAPSHACQRCGRPACPRCAASGPLCGQCASVFQSRGTVEARDRLRKEAQVRRYARGERVTSRALALLGGGAGHIWLGEAAIGAPILLGVAFLASLVFSQWGAGSLPYPSPWANLARPFLAVPLAALIWAIAARDVFGRTRR